ncbi:MAG: DUF4892 domain-containing protein [Pseudomonadales bacterium]
MKRFHASAALCCLLALLPLASVRAAVDVSGARDPLDIERYPHSFIVAYDADDAFLPREYALGRVDKTRRNVRVEHEVRTAATREWATYEMPAGVETTDVVEHYLGVIGGETLFTCKGLDCGRSNLWANEVFNRSMLYGPDRNQFYYAGRYHDHLIALYVIERGNKRVYAHLEVLKPEHQVAVRPNQQLFERLAGEGLATIEGVVPAVTGTLTDADAEVLASLADGFDVFRGQIIYVVCHLYGSLSGAELIERSGRCAGQAVDLLGRAEGPDLVPFGAGPLLPRLGSGSRIELVLPHRLAH